MIGCIGQAVSEELSVDTREVEDAAWFTRDQVRDRYRTRALETARRRDLSPALSRVDRPPAGGTWWIDNG